MIEFPLAARLAAYGLGSLFMAIVINVLCQFLPRDKSEPPTVFHWIPFVGNAVSYGTDPCNFYMQCRQKYGDIFTFVLFGRRMTVYLGVDGNDFILNGKLRDLNAEEIYGRLTTPVFGKNIIYDCPNAKLMEQKKFVKFGLTQEALESYVPMIENEVLDYIKTSATFKGSSGSLDVSAAMAEITIFTAARTLQGPEVRKKLTAEFAELYHDMDLGFQPINFILPWAPLPQNRRRDAAREKMAATYMDLITQRRNTCLAGEAQQKEQDMIAHFMGCAYKDGQAVPDTEITDLMITLLMAGQHSSSSSSAWIMLRLAAHPEIAQELYEEQAAVLGAAGSARPLRYSDLDRLPLLNNTVKETLRLHSSIHSIMRKVTNPIAVPGTPYVVRPDKVLVSSPILTHVSEEHFANPTAWDPHRWDDRAEKEADDDDDDMVDYGYGAVLKGTKSPYLPFGAGRHRCIGEKFAYVNLCTIVLTMVRQLKLRTVDGTASVPPTDYTSLFSRPSQPASIRWEKR